MFYFNVLCFSIELPALLEWNTYCRNLITRKKEKKRLIPETWCQFFFQWDHSTLGWTELFLAHPWDSLPIWILEEIFLIFQLNPIPSETLTHFINSKICWIEGEVSYIHQDSTVEFE